ncbi:MAG: RusA family crossover junction endodeoxyribonuclease [Phycisphaerales bacterium]|jgi:Holliday junction resolvase RusA-like endonuclease
MSENEITFQVHGVPAPGGSKRGFFSPKTKRVIITEDCKRSKPWRALVSSAALDAHQGEPLDGPLRLEVEFVLPRPKHHTGARGLKASAPHFHVIAPDSTKLLRSTEDALKGICWHDDAQVAVQSVSKRYGPRPGAVVRVSRLVEPREREQSGEHGPLFAGALTCGGRRVER